MLESKRKAYVQPTFDRLQEVKKEKKLGVFEKVITKIIDIAVDKIAIAIPILIRKLFGISVENLKDYGYGYGVQSLKDLGIFGYLPLIILKLVNGFTYFINILKRNKFLKTFLMPVLVLVVIAGAVIFLTWWLQPDDYAPYGYLSSDKYYGSNKYDGDYNSYRTQYNYDNSRTAMRNFNGNNYL